MTGRTDTPQHALVLISSGGFAVFGFAVTIGIAVITLNITVHQQLFHQ